MESGLCGAIAEKFVAILAEKPTDDGNGKMATFEDIAAGDETCAPFVEIGAMFAAIGLDVFLKNAKDNGANFGRDAGAGTHRARLVSRVENKIREVTTVAAGNVFEGFEFDMLDAGARVLTRLPALAITTSRLPVTRVITAPMG